MSFTIIHDKTGRPETDWRYSLVSTPAGTRLTEAFAFRWCPLGNRISELAIPRGRQVNRGIQLTLQNLKTTAEKAAPDTLRE